VAARLASFATAILAAALLTGCVFTPLASSQQDTLAKEFITHPAASTIYAYRSPFNHHDTDTVLYLDGRVIGATQPGSYFRIDTTPGTHTLHGTAADIGEFMLRTRPGQLYFVEVEVIGGNSTYTVVPEQAGRERVRACCALLEHWMPPRPYVLR
jgi:hypothetical protein